jgi:hypothetical protein
MQTTLHLLLAIWPVGTDAGLSRQLLLEPQEIRGGEILQDE